MRSVSTRISGSLRPTLLHRSLIAFNARRPRRSLLCKAWNFYALIQLVHHEFLHHQHSDRVSHHLDYFNASCSALCVSLIGHLSDVHRKNHFATTVRPSTNHQIFSSYWPDAVQICLKPCLCATSKEPHKHLTQIQSIYRTKVS